MSTANDDTQDLEKLAEELRGLKEEMSNAKPKRADSADGWLFNAKGEPTGPSERFWIDALAESKDWIFDPTADSFFHFRDGIWERITRAEAREGIERFIRATVGEVEGLNLDKMLAKKNLDPLVERLSGHPCVVKRDAFAVCPHGVILLANGRLQIDRTGEENFESGNRGNREDMQTSRLPISYDKNAISPRLLTWLRRIFSDREDDVQAVAKMAGAVLWGSNRWKKMVVVHGSANLGKSQIPLLVERLVGKKKVCEFETRRLGEKFEMRRFVGKVFLRAEDVEADFMTRVYADTLKQLSGFGSLRVEGKNSHEEFELRGDKMLCATSNFRLRVRADVDRSAWEERLVYLEADGKPYEQAEQDSYFLDALFEHEASGVLNFALAGLRVLLAEGCDRAPISGQLRMRVVGWFCSIGSGVIFQRELERRA